MDNFECENETCAEPNGRYAYVSFAGNTYCLFCYLVYERGVDPDEAIDIEFQGGKP